MKKSKDIITCCDDFWSKYFPEDYGKNADFNPEEIGKQIIHDVFASNRENIDRLMEKAKLESK